jgi:DNA polymerase I
MKTLVIIDANALIHRCFHALPPLTTPKGEPIGAVYGTVNIILKMMRELNPTHIAACFDLGEPTFRHEEYKAYKGKREKTPEDLGPQFAATKKLFDAFGVQHFEKSGFEADDLIGALSEKFKKEADKILIVTGDLDTLQLVEDEKVMVYTMKKSWQETTIYDEKAVKERFELLPNQMTDFKGIKGDPSDNIPGVLGIGEKGAITILKKYGSLENLYKEMEDPLFDPPKEIKAGTIKKLREQKEQAFFSKYLATIRKDITLDVSLDDLEFRGFNPDKIVPLFEEWRFDSLIPRLKMTISADNKEQITETRKENNKSEITISQNNLDSLNTIKNGDGITLYDLGNDLEILWDHKISIIDFKSDELQLIKPILESSEIKKAGWQLKELFKKLKKLDIELNGFNHDIKIAAWVLNSEVRDYSIEKTYQRIFRETLPINEQKTIIVRKISEFQEKKIVESQLENVFYNIEMPLIPVLAQMETDGIELDTAHFQKLSQEITTEIVELEKEIHKIAESDFNISSPKQLSEILFTKLGIPTKGLKKTPGGVISTQETELNKMADKHPIIPLILKHRELMKLKNTYIDPLPELADAEKRIHTNYNQTGTATGRLSSDNPNLQNIPAQGEWAKKIREGFVCDKEKVLISLDYSQIELRIAAALSQDKKMTQAFKDGKDIHSLTASEINNIPLDKITPEMRRQAKVLNFGVLYGMGSRAFSQEAGLSKEKAANFIEEYYHDFVGIKQWQEKIINEGQSIGYIHTLTGRKRWVLDLASQNQKYRAMAERAAINFPIQGLAADIIKLAMIEINKTLKTKGLDENIKMLLQVHDELIFEVYKNYSEKARELIDKIMENAFKLDSVEIKADSKIGKNLAEL